MIDQDAREVLNQIDGSVRLENGAIIIENLAQLRDKIFRLAELSALGSARQQGYARYYTRLIALEAGVYPASIHELYIARGKGEIPSTFTVPAINLRALSFDAARAVFRAAMQIDAKAMIFEIARSEMGYTDQPPAEYATSLLAAAVTEGYSGPVFIQGDHFQVSASRYAKSPETELNAVNDLIIDAYCAGIRSVQTRDESQQSGFATASGAYDA